MKAKHFAYELPVSKTLVTTLGKISSRMWVILAGIAVGTFCTITLNANSSPMDDQRSVAALDRQYQASVKRNDAATMDLLLADDFILVTGSGKTYTKSDLLEEARSGRMRYEHQEDFDETVRIWRDTAVITARLWESGSDNGKPFDYMAWFSDTYVRTPKGWRYVFAQSSLPMPR